MNKLRTAFISKPAIPKKSEIKRSALREPK